MRAPRWALLGVACGIAPPLSLGFGLPPGLAGLAGVAVAAIGMRRGVGTALLAVASLAASLGLYAGLLRATGLDRAIYYRPHERYATFDARHGHRAYAPRVALRTRVPHGDLQAMTREAIAEPREVVFRTDTDGFRNDADYAGEPWVAVGDSFVAGNGTSQDALLTAALRRRGVRAYNLGFPGGIRDYETFWRAFERRHGDAAALLFLFEGNDFPERTGRRPRPAWRSALDRRVRGATAPFRALSTSRVTRALFARVAGTAAIVSGRDVRIHPLAGGRLAFYAPYVERTRRTALTEMEGFDAALERLAPDVHAVFFIPVKYRVYQPWVAPGEVLPHASWAHLSRRCAALGLPCFDLTPALQQRAGALLGKNELVWWRDDTHWNAAGIDAAAAEVTRVLARRAARGRA